MCALTFTLYLYLQANRTLVPVEWADLPVIDLAKAATPEGRAELAPQVRDAMHTHGFFYLVNHGWTEAQVRSSDSLSNRSDRNLLCARQNERIFDIANVLFEHVPEDEKKQFAGDIKKTGSYRGYKLRNYWVSSLGTCNLWRSRCSRCTATQHIDNGVRDQLEHYNRESFQIILDGACEVTHLTSASFDTRPPAPPEGTATCPA